MGLLVALVVWATSRTVIKSSRIEERNRSERAKSRLKPLPPRFIVLDLETTGLRADRHEIIEIGAIKFNCGEEVHSTFNTLVLPNKRISSKVTELTGLDRSVLKRDGRPLSEVIPQLLDFCEDLPIVAFNAGFDRSFIEAACAGLGLTSPSRSWICALESSRLAWPGRSSYRLSALCQDGGIALDDEHRALADCQRALQVYVASIEHVLGPQIARPAGTRA